jgi:hypothetical protein
MKKSRQIYYCFNTSCVLGWSDDFKKGRYQKAWGLKNSYLVPRYHIPKI